MKYIKRVSKVKNDDTKGYIINSTNVVDKEKNTYSANIIDGLVSSEEYLIGNILFTRKGNIVYVNMSGGSVSDDVSTIIIKTLPEKFRPKEEASIAGIYTTTNWENLLGRLDIKTTGAISVRKLKTGTYGTTENATNGYVCVNGTYAAKN